MNFETKSVSLGKVCNRDILSITISSQGNSWFGLGITLGSPGIPVHIGISIFKYELFVSLFEIR